MKEKAALLGADVALFAVAVAAYASLRPVGGAWEVVVTAVVICGCLAPRIRFGTTRVAIPSAGVTAVVTATLVAAALWLPKLWPWFAPALATASAILLHSRLPKRDAPWWSAAIGAGREVSRGAMICGIVLVAWDFTEPYLQFLRTPAPLVGTLGASCGVPILEVADTFAVNWGGKTLYFGSGPRHSELLPFVLAAILCFRRLGAVRLGSFRTVAAVTLVLCGLELYREAFMAGHMMFCAGADLAPAPHQYLTIYVAAASIGFSLLCALVLGLAGPGSGLTAVPPATVLRWPAVVALAAGASLSICLFFEQSSIPKAGRIAIDASHSEWEWMDTPLDRNVFGTKSTYSMWSFRILLEQFFPSVHANREGPLTLERLRSFDVWILKTPTRPYSDEEVDALQQYVREGGGLWLIGDHTDIFGMNTYLNQVGERFGIRFRSDALIPLGGRESRQYWERTRPYDPILTEIPTFLFATSCSLELDPWRSRPLMTGDRLLSDRADYSSNTFFGDFEQQGREPWGRFHQAAVARAGRGRVAAFTDSTVFSSFYVQFPGKWELAVHTTRRLNGCNPSDAWRWFLGPAAAFVLGLCVRSRRIAALFGALGFVTAGLVCSLAPHAASDPPIEPAWTLPRAAFLVTEESALPLRLVPPHDENSPTFYQTAFVWFQRAEILPFVVQDAGRLEGYQLAVVLDPGGSGLPAAQLGQLGQFMQTGGSVLFLSSSPDATREAFSAWGIPGSLMEARPRGQSGSATSRGVGRELILSVPDPTFVFDGLENLLALPDGACIVGESRVGAGRAIFCCVPAMFSNAFMGGVTEGPSPERYARFEFLWALLDRSLGRERSPR